MTFGESISTCLKKYISIEGRASRSEYWWFILFCFLVQGAGGFVSHFLGGILALALFLPTIAAGCRRLHDTNKSAWMALIGLIPLIGGLLLLYWFVIPGTDGSNDFGGPPGE